MKCPRCGAEMKIKSVRVDNDIYGNPIYNDYAYCYNCRIKRDLGRQKKSSGNPKKLSSRHAAKIRKRKLKIILILLLTAAAIAAAGFLISRRDTFFKPSKPKESSNTNIMETGSYKISMKSLEKLVTGMPQKEVIGIIGNSGNKLMKTMEDKTVLERCQWTVTGKKGTVILTFLNEKLASISRAGVENFALAPLSGESAKQVKFGMSYKDVVKLFGIDGTFLSETAANGAVTTMYTWHDNDSDIKVTVVFRDGKVQSVS